MSCNIALLFLKVKAYMSLFLSVYTHIYRYLYKVSLNHANEISHNKHKKEERNKKSYV